MDASAYAALPRVVVDNGSGFARFGLASTKKPPYVVPNCIGHPKKKVSSHYSESHSSGASEQSNSSSTHSVSEHSGFVSDNCYTLIEYFCNRPQVNSLVYDPESQRAIWDKYIGRYNMTTKDGVLCSGNMLSINPESTAICLTEANLCPVQSRQLSAEIIFEDFGFPLASFLPSQTASAYFYMNLKSWKLKHELKCYPKEPTKKFDLSCCLVVDCGFGSTHAVPFVNGEPVQSASQRTNSGGFQCNSYLKNITALRSVNLEFNELMKEESCYVSLDFDLELKAAKKLLKIQGTNLLAHQYVLPIYTSKSKTQMTKHFTNYRKSTPPLLNERNNETIRSLVSGEVNDLKQLEYMLERDKSEGNKSESKFLNGSEVSEFSEENLEKEESEDQCVNLYAERFSVPEIIFSPQDIKLNDCGIVELIYRSISLCHPAIQPILTSNIFLCGGSTKFPGFVQRLYKDLRPMIPQAWEIGIYSTEDPSLSAFYGARMWTNNDSLFLSNGITRNVYFENGGSVIKINELIKAKEEHGKNIF